MSNFTFAIVSIVYALVCLTKEPDKGKSSTSKSAEDSFKKRTEGELKTKVIYWVKNVNELKPKFNL